LHTAAPAVPVEIAQGTRVSQSVVLTLQGEFENTDQSREDESLNQPLKLTIDATPIGTLPPIGLGVASHGENLTPRETERLRTLHLSHLRLDLLLSQNYEEALRRATEEIRVLELALEIALFVTDNAAHELREFVVKLHELKPKIKSWLVFHVDEKTTSARWIKIARQHLAPYNENVPIGAGTNLYFTDLNRKRPPIHVLDCVNYSINPQVHAFDNASLIETLGALPSTIESARPFVGDLPLTISPITLRPRFNPVATVPEREATPDELPNNVDARQMSLFGAAWTLGALKQLAKGGVSSLTLYETTGWRGVMETEVGSSAPFAFLPGNVYPMYHVLADVGEFAGAEILGVACDDELKLCGLALRRDSAIRVLVASLSAQMQSVEMQVQTQHTTFELRVLDENNALDAMQNPENFRAQANATMPLQTAF
jgi:hypothetical protein